MVSRSRVSKAEVGTWPVIRLVARLGRTVYVSRARGRTGEEAAAMRERLQAGGSLSLQPHPFSRGPQDPVGCLERESPWPSDMQPLPFSNKEIQVHEGGFARRHTLR